MEYKNSYSTYRHTRRVQSERRTDNIAVGSCNRMILVCTILLIAIGIIMVFSASYDKYMFEYFKKDVTWAIMGLGAMTLISFINYNSLNNRKLAILLYILSIILLVAVLILGRSVGGAKRRIWGIQPSEFVKFFTIIILAHMLDTNREYTTTHKGFWKCIFIFVAVPVALIGAGNASTAIILGVVCMAMMFSVIPKITWFLEIGALGGILGAAVLMLGKGFRMARINAWLHPFDDTSDTSYQIVHSLYAVASGGLSGLGLGASREKLSYLPEAHNDMIFSIICEELGLLGAAGLVVLFSILIFCGYRTAIKCYNTFGALIAVGITTMIALQVIINMGVATNTIPNTGIPMPFISYGGSSMVINLLSIGLLLSISRFYKEPQKKSID